MLEIMRTKPERITAVLFLCVIMFCMCFMPVGVARGIMRKQAYNKTVIDWAKIYPFEANEKHSSLHKKESIFIRLKTKFEEYTSQKLGGTRRYKIIEAAKKYEDLIGWNIVPLFDQPAVAHS